MRVAAFTGFGGPDDVAIREVPDPEPGRGEAVVDVEAASLNRHDLSILEGSSSSVGESDLPFVSGLDLAGTVASVGDDVENVTPGDRVVLCPNQTCGTCRHCRDGPENLCVEYGLYHGTFAEQALVDADRLIHLPDSVDVTDAAALPTAYLTAWHMLRRGDVTAGDLVFVPGATGGVGVAAVQLAEVLGARSIGTSTSAAKLDRLAEVGADHTIRGRDPDTLADAVADIGTPDVALNHLGGAYTDAALSTLRRGGRMVVCGRTVADRSDISIPRLFWKHHRILGSTMGTQTDLETLVDLVADEAFEPVIDREFPLADADDAFAAMQDRTAFGKLLLRP